MKRSQQSSSPPHTSHTPHKGSLTRAEAKRRRWLRMSLIVLVMIMGVGFRTLNLGQKAYWVDEVHTSVRIAGYTKADITAEQFDNQVHAITDLSRYQVPTANPSLREVMTTLAQHPEHPPLYYLLARWWMQGAIALGIPHSVTVTRTLSLLFSLLALPCVVALARELFRSKLTAILALYIVALSPLHILYGQEAREYSLWTLMTLLSCWTFLRAIRRPSLKHWIPYGLTLTIGLYSHLLFTTVAIAHTLYFFLFADSPVPPAPLSASKIQNPKSKISRSPASENDETMGYATANPSYANSPDPLPPKSKIQNPNYANSPNPLPPKSKIQNPKSKIPRSPISENGETMGYATANPSYANSPDPLPPKSKIQNPNYANSPDPLPPKSKIQNPKSKISRSPASENGETMGYATANPSYANYANSPDPLPPKSKIQNPKSKIPFLLTLTTSLLLFSPWIGVFLNQLGQVQTVVDATQRDPSLGYLINVWGRNLSRVWFSGDLGSLNLLWVLVMVYGLVYLWRTEPRSVGGFLLLLIGVNALPLMASDALTGGISSTRIRYLLPAYSGLQLAIAHLFAQSLAPYFAHLFSPSLVNSIAHKRKTIGKRIGLVALVIVLLGGAIAGCVNTLHQTNWAKSDKSLYYPQMAAVINASDHPLVITDNSATYTLVLAHLLKDEGHMQLVNLQHLQRPNDLMIPSQIDDKSISDLFLFAPSPPLRRHIEMRAKKQPKQRQFGPFKSVVRQNSRFQLLQSKRLPLTPLED